MAYTTLATKVKENNIEVFENPLFGMIRTLEIDGKPYFIASDVTKALGYTNSSKAIKDHCRWVTKRYVPHPQSADKKIEVNIIPQGDVMRLAAKSELPGAEKFESWIFDDVIPTVLNHGIYATDSVIDNILNNPDFGIEVLTKLKEERTDRIKAEQRNAILTHVNKTYTMTEIAKELGLRSANELNRWLSDMHIQYKVNGTWVMYSDYSDRGYEDIKQEVLDNGKVVYHRKITQIGREFILNMYRENKA
nr:MAG TPA: repressor domain protein [Bacteriophage sp.]